MTTFFVPNAPDGDSEAELERIAAIVGRAVPARRVRRIEFGSNGEDWVAEVGGKFEGARVVERTRNKQKVSETERIPGRATVLAIFPGPSTYEVVIDKHPFGTSRSEWEPFFLAGVPTVVDYFDDPEPAAE